MTDVVAPTQGFSLQKRLMLNTLISSVVSGVLSLIIVVGVIAYDSHELLDDVLEENAKLLIEGHTVANQQMKYYLNEYNEEFDLEYQIIAANGQLLEKSEHAAAHAFVADAEDDEFYNIHDRQHWWRVYVRNRADSGLQIQIAQPWEQRYAHLLPALGHFLWLMLLLWLLSLAAAWLAIRRGIKALQHVSERIGQKHVQDLTPLQPQQMMLELQPVVDSVNRLLGHLQQALATEQRFTADAAHELRTPLAAIQMKLQLLQRKHQMLLQPIDEELEQLQQDVKRSTVLIDNLLLLARIDPEHSSSLVKSQFLVITLLQELSRDLAPLLAAKHIALEQDWQLDATQTLYANRELCFSALRNILDNAVRYSHPFGKIRFKVFVDQHHLHCVVQDEGIGVDAQQRLQLTKRFFRVLGTEQQGSGLGLSIVQQIAELHQGQLQFIDGLSTQQGLGVWLRFPLQAAGAEPGR
jgi:two-component system sensor histidine kinase QseC